jgi:hypothetical protein
MAGVFRTEAAAQREVKEWVEAWDREARLA